MPKTSLMGVVWPQAEAVRAHGLRSGMHYITVYGLEIQNYTCTVHTLACFSNISLPQHPILDIPVTLSTITI